MDVLKVKSLNRILNIFFLILNIGKTKNDVTKCSLTSEQESY